MWLTGLGIGTFFGWFWGYNYGRLHSAVIVSEPLPDTPEKMPERQ